MTTTTETETDHALGDLHRDLESQVDLLRHDLRRHAPADDRRARAMQVHDLATRLATAARAIARAP